MTAPMITAKDAYEITLNIMNTADEREYEDVCDMIYDAVNDGQLYVLIEKRLCNSNVEKLKELGYKVVVYQDMIATTIHWDYDSVTHKEE